MHRNFWRLPAAGALVATAACHPEFQLKSFTSNESIYSASLREFQRHHWDNAITGFEKLTTDLPPRDSLLPRSYWYLASSHESNGEHLLAAESFNRLVETFPEDSLAPLAALDEARAYKSLWRRPELDPTNGETALAAYNTLIGLYPTSPLIAQAQKEIDTLEDWFAQKDFASGSYYYRRKCYDCGMIYFKDIITKYANTPTAKAAGIKLVEGYRAVRYNDDAADMCAQLRQRYPTDPDVRLQCANIATPKPQAAATAIPAAPPTGPPGSPPVGGKPPTR
jgi:outer membrane protein assembly factor BamD